MILIPFLAGFPPVIARSRAFSLPTTNANEESSAYRRQAKTGLQLWRLAAPRGPNNPQNKKRLSFEIKDRRYICGTTFTWPPKEPSHEHANTCSALNAGSRSRYSAASLAGLQPFPFPSAIHLPLSMSAGLPATPALCKRFNGLIFASSVSTY